MSKKDKWIAKMNFAIYHLEISSYQIQKKKQGINKGRNINS